MLSDRMNEIKQKTGLTNASWAERSGVPISTVSRILSGATENPGFQTVLDLISAAEVLLSAVLPDGLVFPDSPASTPAAELLAEKDRRIAGLERQVAFRSRWMRLLAIICTTLVAVLAFLLIYDALSPHVGWFRS